MLTPIMLGTAAVIFAIALLVTRQNKRRDDGFSEMMARAESAQAQVVGMNQKMTMKRGGVQYDEMPGYFPVVRFRTHDGRDVEAEVMIGARPKPAKPGDTVEVRYDRDNPKQVVLARGFGTPRSLGCVAKILTVSLWGLGAMFVLFWVLLKLVLNVPG